MNLEQDLNIFLNIEYFLNDMFMSIWEFKKGVQAFTSKDTEESKICNIKLVLIGQRKVWWENDMLPWNYLLIQTFLVIPERSWSTWLKYQFEIDWPVICIWWFLSHSSKNWCSNLNSNRNIYLECLWDIQHYLNKFST